MAGADIVFCAAPVGRLPDLVREALDASGDETVVTDVGSTKRDLVEGLASHPAAGRFIGGHPIAGAETAGVDSARAELFEGARWYLTPGDQAGGVHYDRLQRALADLGARPQAIDAELHDRLMATVSHLPHVIANVMVSQAEVAISDEGERLPEVGRSFRDTTRVAGANPAIWKDIFTSNADALAAEIDRAVERLREAAELIRGGDAGAVEAWQSRARARATACWRRRVRWRPHRASSHRREQAGRGRRDRAGAWPRGREHRGHGAAARRRHAHAARSRCGWPARATRPERSR